MRILVLIFSLVLLGGCAGVKTNAPSRLAELHLKYVVAAPPTILVRFVTGTLFCSEEEFKERTTGLEREIRALKKNE